MGIHSQSKHKYRNVFGDSNIQYYDFDSGDALSKINIWHYYNKNYKLLLVFTQPYCNQKLSNIFQNGHRDYATCNVCFW